MCLGVPVQVIEPGAATALCRGRNGDEHVHMLLVGMQPAGTWVLNFLGWAREVISADDADQINRALDGLREIMNGAESIDVDHYFPGLGSARETG
ncbi:MAG: HypC/HybG/HupF family hydrogenase formation chaperone [Chromatiaceae bacterium]|nr:HypC/HybG/HupF family hydrogenase formation chaperone [Gammaproteobacteria bacterium]MCP5306597.1 HypC/HybG/HupF family hydrogenase formation chaperone [Chromatiaceae bacterium]MCP5312149.1 HypC/HybG/HupF family hydrogenase formation chaperone [Chromatiaceae bacterium]